MQARTIDLDKLRDPQAISTLSDEELRVLTGQVVDLYKEDRKANQLFYYVPTSPHTEKVHRSTARIVGIFGGNRCLPLDAPVLMADGTWRSLGEIEPGDSVIAADPTTGVTNVSTVRRIYRSGMKAVYRTTFSDGGFFEATLDHRVPLYLGSGRRTSKGHPRLPKKRLLRDYFEPINRRGATNPSKRIAAVSPGWIFPVHHEGKPEVRIHPYLLGALLGDGSMTQRTTRFHNIDPAVIERVRVHLADLGLELRKYTHGCEYGISGGRALYDELIRLGLQGKRDRVKHIPEACFYQGATFRRELLAGLVDTDGTRDFFVSASHDLALGFARLVRMSGGKATIHERKTDSAFGRAWAVYWRLNERLPLSRPDKQAKPSGREVDYRRRICRSIKFTRYAECGDIEVDHDSHCYVTGDYVIVSNSSKTETALVEILAHATGVVPLSLRDCGIDWTKKLRGPINVRVVCESITATLHDTILPKLQFWKWSGAGNPDDPRTSHMGHWGWIPEEHLIKRDWAASWSEKLRTLRFKYKNPETGEFEGESHIQFMSNTQDASDFASGEFHFILQDEPPPKAIWKENFARLMSANGRMFLAMTWPDEPGIAVDWIHDEIYEPGQPGPGQDAHTECFTIFTTDNRTIDQNTVAEMAAKMDEDTRRVRIYGGQIRFSHLIHPLFTDQERDWCFSCRTPVLPVDGQCPKGHGNVLAFCHVRPFETIRAPTLFLLDPHPRKPHMMLWVQVTPQDDYWCRAELQVEGDCMDVAEQAFELERNLGLQVGLRLMDPNMGLSPASQKRGITWQMEFQQAKLWCDLADDSYVGRDRINEYLKPDDRTLEPRLLVHPDCARLCFQMKRYRWSDWKRKDERDLRQEPNAKDDDYPTLLKYMMNYLPSFRGLATGPRVIRRTGNVRIA